MQFWSGIIEDSSKWRSDVQLLTDRPFTTQGFNRKFSNNTANLMKAKRGAKGKKKGKSPTAGAGELDKDLLSLRSKEMMLTMHRPEDDHLRRHEFTIDDWAFTIDERMYLESDHFSS